MLKLALSGLSLTLYHLLAWVSIWTGLCCMVRGDKIDVVSAIFAKQESIAKADVSIRKLNMGGRRHPTSPFQPVKIVRGIVFEIMAKCWLETRRPMK
ncbi:hypothetical protein GX51_01746 [Blastomyces parvus]|uniref:Secreted protein n=1 Tax=Blastomyces parvus TaxID=2060905 RepID=A0A2B7XES9_9EURO|nr:hypothetical protein GX51_01746 [Blastomyces parvus]